MEDDKEEEEKENEEEEKKTNRGIMDRRAGRGDEGHIALNCNI